MIRIGGMVEISGRMPREEPGRQQSTKIRKAPEEPFKEHFKREMEKYGTKRF